MKISVNIMSMMVLLASLSCSPSNKTQEIIVTENHEVDLVALVVEDIYKSSLWYQEKLGFKEDKPIADYSDYGVKVGFLNLGDFHLELVESKGSIPADSLSIPEGHSLNGLLKLGFMVKDIDSLYHGLQKYDDVEFITSVQSLSDPGLDIPWPQQHFMVYDPDGNMLQFFSSNGLTKLSQVPQPWLLMITVDNLQNMSSWYSDNFNFKYLVTQGEVGNQRAVLSKGNFILELYRPEKVAFYDFIEPKVEYHGFRKVGFSVDSIAIKATQLESANAEIVMPIREGDMDWSAQSMIVKDLEGNWVQVLEPDDS